MDKARLRHVWRRISNRDRLCYMFTLLFGVTLLALMIFFSFGYMLGEREAPPFLRDDDITIGEPEQRILLIDEPNPIIRGIEMATAVGMIILGVERLKTHKGRIKGGLTS